MSNVQINTGEVGFYAKLCTPSGNRSTFLSEADAAAYRSDPDGFAASYFGLDIGSYREWIGLKGAPLCSARTRDGSPCKNSVSPSELDADEWKALHRKARCHAHSYG